MDTLFWLFDWYSAKSFLMTPLFFSIFIMGISLWIFQLLGERYLRFPLLVVVSLVFLVLSFFSGEYTRELYLNLSMQVFMALLAVLIVAFAHQQESWFLPTIVVFIFAVILQFFTPADNIGSNIPTTLGATLIGAMIVAYMLRQEWAWSPVRQERRLSSTMRRTRQEQVTTQVAMARDLKRDILTIWAKK